MTFFFEVSAFHPIISHTHKSTTIVTETHKRLAFLNHAKNRIRHKKLHLSVKSFNLDDIEQKATQASETWDIWCTSFFSAEETAQIQQNFHDRSDVACFPIGGFAPGFDFDGKDAHRARFVFTNPDLGMDQIAAEKDYCSVLRIENIASSEAYDPWANVLDSIGVNLKDVGDVVIVDKNSDESVYLVVIPEVAKTCARLLPKVLPGPGLTVTVLEADGNGDGETWIPEGEIQELVIQRLDKRQQKKK